MTVVDTSRLNQSFEPSNTDVDGTSNPGETTTTTVTNTTGAVTSVPTSRIISFTLTSTPSGASILLNGVNTNFITPHVMKFQETELLTPKVISIVNGTNNSLETYVLSSEVITTTTGMSTNNNSNGNNSGRGNSNGGGADSDYSTNPSDPNFRPELAPSSRPTGNTQR